MRRGNFRHALDEILFLAVTSAICGIVDWDEMEMFGKAQIEWFRKYFPFTNGMPSHDTIGRLFSKLSPEEFCKYFTEWVETLRKDLGREVIAIDGKAVKGSAQKSRGGQIGLLCLGICVRKSIGVVSASCSGKE